MTEQNMYIHLVAGGLAGSTGTILTCPLEVIKTRLQSSTSSYKRMTVETGNTSTSTRSANTTAATQSSNFCTSNLNNLNRRAHYYKFSTAHSHSINSTILFKNNHLNPSVSLVPNGNLSNINFVNSINTSSKTLHPRAGLGIYYHLKFILQNEGYRALFKGLAPTLVGVVPNRAIYFYSYANSKIFFSKYVKQDSSLLHILSAFVGGFSAVTMTNPIWFVKTRMQLDESRRGVGVIEVANKIFKDKGLQGFYKGISASYFGIIETAIYFTLYEKLKSFSNNEFNDSKSNLKFISYFGSAGLSKSIASCLCYPHEVARTRLRQEGSKYTGFFQTLRVVVNEEGARGLYRGMGTHLIRQIPNNMIVMITYELIVNYLKDKESVEK